MDESMAEGRFRLGERIGGSGRVGVYLGSDHGGEQVVVTLVEPFDEQESMELMRRAEAVERISRTTDIARVLDHGMQGALFYVVREYVQGEDLRSLLERRGKLDWVTAVRLVTFACAAVHGVGAEGVVHGSLRPERLILTPEGTVSVVGFELPPRIGLGPLDETSKPENAHYVSPEQVTGQEPTTRSDVYSIGAVLYELVTGAVPFEATTAAAVASKHVTEAPERPRRVEPEVPASVETVLLRTLSKDPYEREGSPGLVCRELDEIITGGTQPVFDMPERRSPWGWIIAVALALLLGIGGTWGFLTLRQPAIPDVSGYPAAKAKNVLKDAGFRVGQIEYDATAGSPEDAGTVVEQVPAAGRRLPEGTSVDVVIAGAEMVQAPNVVGSDEAAALVRLSELRLTVAEITRTPDPAVPQGQVIAQTPMAGSSLAKGTGISLVISSGPRVGTIPDVVGKTRTDAAAAAEAAGYVVVVVNGYSPTVVVGSIIAQNPPAGVASIAGSKVTLTVSRGPAPAKQVRVPTLIGLTEAAAKTEIEALGLKAVVNTQTDPANIGKVVGQAPASGTNVNPGSNVTITVGK